MRNIVVKISKSRILLGLLFIVSTFQNPALASQHPTVVFCFVEWIPFSYMTNQQATGISIEILTLASKRAGINPVFKESAWNRCVRNTQQGKFDAIIDSPKYDGLISGPSYYSFYDFVFWVREDSPIQKYEGIKTLKGRKLGGVLGYVYPDNIIIITKT